MPLLPIGGDRCGAQPIGGSGGRGPGARWIWRFDFNMAEASSVSAGSGSEEKGPEGPVFPGTTISRIQLLDSTVDMFLQKLVAAGSYQKFTDCYKCFHQLQPEVTRRIYDKFITQLQTSIWEEVSDIKAEGNLEAVLNALDAIVEEGGDRREPAWRPSGSPEEDLRSVLAPCLLRQRDALQRRLHRQEAENKQLADAVLAGRRQLAELQRQGQARWQAWQALRRGQEELVAVPRAPE